MVYQYTFCRKTLFNSSCCCIVVDFVLSCVYLCSEYLFNTNMSAEGFVKAASNNLPAVDIFMVMEFIKQDERFNSAEIRGVKTAAATREEYGDNAVGYVELKRENSICIVRCKICPEHKVRSKNYAVYLTVNEAEEKIINVECKDCAASAGGCKHALAFLMWVHRRSEEPSPTEVTSYWKKAPLSAVGTSVKYISVAEFSQPKNDPSTSDTSSEFRGKLVTAAKAANLQGHLLKYALPEFDDKFAKLSIYKLLLKFIADGGTASENFLAFAVNRISTAVVIEAEKKTRTQTDSPLWHELRYGRITASKLYEVAHCKTTEGVLVESIIGSYKVKDNKFMKRGRHLEKYVLVCVEKKMKLKFHECGFFISQTLPVFGASPDAISKDYVVEIKCPSSDKSRNLYIKNNTITDKFKAQIHLQMLCSNRRKSLFCVAAPDYETSKNVDVLEINFDEIFLNNLMEPAMEMWKNFVFPRLYQSAN